MLFRRIILSFFAFIFFISGVYSQKSGLAAIDTFDLKEHLTYLASDELQGRSPGTEVDGLNMAADYIAQNAAKIGLKPGVPGYFQKVDLVAESPDKENFIEVKNSNGKSLYRSPSFIDYSGIIKKQVYTQLPVVLAGFGTHLADTDLDGKVVLVSAGTRNDFGEKIFHWNNRLERSKIDSLAAKHPKAIIICTNPNDKEGKVFKQISVWFNRERYSLKQDEKEEIPVLLVLPEVGDKLLGGKGQYRKYLEIVAENKEFVEIQNKTITFSTGKQTRETEVKNVVGVVEGSDPVLKDECVVFMAHYDHLGVREDGDVYNGADDNGSGTVTVMEVAQAFATLEQKPKRSIVFLWVTCEELGMFGSNFYTQHPVFSLEKTTACFNLDMVGRVREPRDSVWDGSLKKVKDFDGLYALSNAVWPELAEINNQKCEELGLVPDPGLPANFLRSSDHYNFHKFGVPVLNYATGYHADYHKVGDEVEKISFKKMKRVADLCFMVGMEVANHDKIERKSAEKQ